MYNIQNNLNTQTRKITVNFSIDKTLYEQFKRVAQKDMRKYSNIVEGSIRRYVQSKIWNLLVFTLSVVFINLIKY